MLSVGAPSLPLEAVVAAPTGLLFVGVASSKKVRVFSWPQGGPSNSHVQASQLLVSFLGSFTEAITKKGGCCCYVDGIILCHVSQLGFML